MKTEYFKKDNIEKINKGDMFLCVKNYIMDDDEIAYLESRTYTSEMDGCITDEGGDKYHEMWPNDDDFYEHFEKVIFPKSSYNTPEPIGLRDELAGKAMQGIVSTFTGKEEFIYHEQIAKDAYDIADAMLKQRKL